MFCRCFLDSVMLTGLAGWALPIPAHAETVGVYAGVGYDEMVMEGQLRNHYGTPIKEYHHGFSTRASLQISPLSFLGSGLVFEGGLVARSYDPSYRYPGITGAYSLLLGHGGAGLRADFGAVKLQGTVGVESALKGRRIVVDPSEGFHRLQSQTGFYGSARLTFVPFPFFRVGGEFNASTGASRFYGLERGQYTTCSLGVFTGIGL